MHKIIKIVTILFSICILWIIYLANTGTNSLFFSFIKSIPLGDKFGHFFLFGSLTYLLIIVLKFRAIEFKNLYFYYGALLVMIFVIIEEFSQNYISHRTFDYIDLAADFIGIATASIIANMTKNTLFLKKL